MIDVFVPGPFHLSRTPCARGMRFYSRARGALLFGLLSIDDEAASAMKMVYACHSYDVVAHETPPRLDGPQSDADFRGPTKFGGGVALQKRLPTCWSEVAVSDERTCGSQIGPRAEN